MRVLGWSQAGFCYPITSPKRDLQFWEGTQECYACLNCRPEGVSRNATRTYFEVHGTSNGLIVAGNPTHSRNLPCTVRVIAAKL